MQIPSLTVRAPKRRLIIADDNDDDDRQPLVASSAAAKENISPEAQTRPAKRPAIGSRRTPHKGNDSKSPTATATRLTKPAVDRLTERLASLTLTGSLR
ncbi:hypothetical protein H0H93_004177 [Arthromyces matolae]|nr:hypothetical protein H0H93_004177 [Arthromyces matolae]